MVTKKEAKQVADKSKDKKSKEICHVCGKEKKPYIVFLTNDIFSLIHHEMARENGPICERCDKYFAMTLEFKDATEEEYKNAKKAAEFSRYMLEWWIKDKDMDGEEDNLREWGGTYDIAKWLREKLNKK